MLTEKQRQHNAITCVMSMKCEAVLFGKECSRMFFLPKFRRKNIFSSPSPSSSERRCGEVLVQVRDPRDYDNEHCRNGNVKYEMLELNHRNNPST